MFCQIKYCKLILEQSGSIRGILVPLFIGFNFPLLEHKSKKKNGQRMQLGWFVPTPPCLYMRASCPSLTIFFSMTPVRAE